MSFAQVRAYIETRVVSAFPGVPVVFDNVQETPPALPYVVCLISYPTTTLPVLSAEESMIEQLRGNLQISCYAERGEGMGPLEDMAAQGMALMDRMYDWSDFHTKVRCGQISGPTPSLAGTQPYSLVTLSCAFNAQVTVTRQGVLTNQVALVDLLDP